MSLAKFIERENMYARVFKMPEMDPNNLTTEQKKQLAGKIACSLSPENLTCDGELRGAALKEKLEVLTQAKKDLEALGVTVPEY